MEIKVAIWERKKTTRTKSGHFTTLRSHVTITDEDIEKRLK